MIGESLVKDPSLAPEGHRKIDWVAQHAPVLNKIAGEQLADGSLRGRKVAMTIHLEAKTAYLALLLSEAGAEVTVSGSNPLSTQDDVCAALAERGVRVFATHDPADEEFERYLHRTLETGPEIVNDDRDLKAKGDGGGGRPALPGARRQRRQDEASLRQPLRHRALLAGRPPLQHKPLYQRQGGRGNGIRLGVEGPRQVRRWPR